MRKMPPRPVYQSGYFPILTLRSLEISYLILKATLTLTWTTPVLMNNEKNWLATEKKTLKERQKVMKDHEKNLTVLLIHPLLYEIALQNRLIRINTWEWWGWLTCRYIIEKYRCETCPSSCNILDLCLITRVLSIIDALLICEWTY